MGPLAVLAVQPGVELGLQGLGAVEQLLVHDRTEELLQHGAVEPLDEPVRPRAAHPGSAVLDVVERQVELVGVPLGAAELPAPPRPAGRACFANRIDGLLTIDCR